jgi:hypothetical protein
LVRIQWPVSVLLHHLVDSAKPSKSEDIPACVNSGLLELLWVKIQGPSPGFTPNGVEFL